MESSPCTSDFTSFRLTTIVSPGTTMATVLSSCFVTMPVITRSSLVSRVEVGVRTSGQLFSKVLPAGRHGDSAPAFEPLAHSFKDIVLKLRIVTLREYGHECIKRRVGFLLLAKEPWAQVQSEQQAQRKAQTSAHNCP